MNTIGALLRDQAGVATRGVNGECILLDREHGNCILASLIIRRLAIVFIELESIARAGENIEIKFFGVVDSTPTNLGPERDDSSRLGEDGNIFKCYFDLAPTSALPLFAVKEIK